MALLKLTKSLPLFTNAYAPLVIRKPISLIQSTRISQPLIQANFNLTRFKTTEKKVKESPKTPIWKLPRSRKVNNLQTAEQIASQFPNVIPPPETLPATFSELGIHENFVNLLASRKITKPTLIQTITIPQILSGSDVMCASNTGSGKTVSFLLPIIQKLTDAMKSPTFKRRGQRTRCLVLVPTRELLLQSLAVANSLNPDKVLKIYGMAGGLKVKETVEFNNLNNGLDILISTPDRFLFHFEKEHIYLEDMSFFVVDEADSMTDRPYDDMLKKIITPLKTTLQNAPSITQVVLVSATITKPILELVEYKKLSAIKLAASPYLHRNADTLNQFFIETPQPIKKERLLETLKKPSNKGRPTIVFVNAKETAVEVYNFLIKNNYAVSMLCAAITPEKREVSFEKFLKQETRILVATDVASRGLDFVHVEHVINYDMSLTPIGYLHRVGRTARLGAPGKATSFITSADQRMAHSLSKLGETGMEKVVASYRKIAQHKKQMEKGTKKNWAAILNSHPPGYFDAKEPEETNKEN